MKLSNTRIGLIAGTVTIAAFALVFTLATPQTASAYDPGPGGFMGRGGPARIAAPDTYLLEELAEFNISAEDLEAAHQAVAEAALQQAVDESRITQERADAIKERAGARIFGMIGRFGRFGRSNFDANATLAAELGITEAQLDAARTAAHETRMAQALADGKFTQEQYDRMQAMQALKTYLDEQGLQDNIRAAYETAIAAAVADGVISQDLADELLSNQRGFGLRSFQGKFQGKRGGHDFRGKGFTPPLGPGSAAPRSPFSF